MSKILSMLGTVLLLVVTAHSGLAGPALAKPSDPSTKTFSVQGAGTKALNRINAMRAEAGFDPVVLHEGMSAHAQQMAEDWAAGDESKELWDYNNDATGTDAFVPFEVKSIRGCRNVAKKPKKMALGPFTYASEENADSEYFAFGWAKNPEGFYVYVAYTFAPYEPEAS